MKPGIFRGITNPEILFGSRGYIHTDTAKSPCHTGRALRPATTWVTVVLTATLLGLFAGEVGVLAGITSIRDCFVVCTAGPAGV